ncbi:MAG: S41 family peptidase [Paludibacteraceae bacterium]|nr:S41 family peptidase [Paludibacteraceae bacterium]MBR4713354.1 S41 family peptidase [Paludibacteraceae bacterium]
MRIARIVFATLLAAAIHLNAHASVTYNDMQKLQTTVVAIDRYYLDTVNAEKLIDNAINGMLEKLDPHSKYIPKSEVKKMNEPLDGKFEGIGVVFQMMEDTLLVIQTISGGPSEKVGIFAGDRIVYVNDSTIAGVNMQNTDIMKRLRGPKGTSVNVKVLRRGVKELIEFKIIRDVIPIYSIDAAYMVDDKIGYIKVNKFSETTLQEYTEAMNKLKARGMKSLILDLQDNGGGYLKTAVQLASTVLSPNKLVVYSEGVSQPRETFTTTGKPSFEKGDLVVLVNESSASASEILSGSIQDWDRGLIVGRRTFGKGLVQKPIPLQDGSQIRLTVAQYFIPSGRCVQRPYKNNLKNYDKDFIERYNRGELMHEDSISFPDSLKYFTLEKKRPVYGGGGIMPDLFVPLDTTKYSKYHRDLAAKNVLNNFVLNYLDKHRSALEKKYNTNGNEKKKEAGFAQFNQTFQLTDADLKEVTDAGEKEKVEFNEEQFTQSKPLIMKQLKAMIARDLWNTSEYYQIMNDENPIFLKGVEALRNKELYKKGMAPKEK